MKRQTFFLFPIISISMLLVSCHRQLVTSDVSKINFDYSHIDERGFRNGLAPVDYEFCIPAKDDALKKVRQIEPDVKVMKSSRGRVGCTDEQWLCIVNTMDDAWKKKLEQIATLSFVGRIEETFYE